MGEPCGQCGRENAPDHRFCAWCGHELARTVAPGTAERRWVTVVFADLSGYTPASERMDPEDVRAMVDPGMTRCTEIVEEHGGWVNRILGDAVLAVFGAPVAHGDDADRAVRAALELQRCVTEHAEDFGGLQMRIGVNTGEVMFAPVGPHPERDLTVTGDVANTAARLQTAAEPGQVLVADATRAATKESIAYEPVAPRALKGKAEPVTTWIARGVHREPGERLLSTGPIIGRDTELELVDSIWRRTVDTAEPHLVTVLGVPGIGKTKLVREVADAIARQGGRVARGTSLPYGERVPYAAFGQLLKELAGIFENDDAGDARAKLDALVARVLPPADTVLVDHLAVLLGVGDGEGDVEQRMLFAAARELIEALARQQPTVFVIEDIHWADGSLLDLLEWLPRRLVDTPALFLTAARPELLDVRPTWGGGLTSYTALPLAPLSTTQTRALTTLLLSDRPDGEALVEHVDRMAGGNPLFVEEIVSWAADHGTTDAFPTSVRAIIAARLDALPDAQRQLLLDASVVGEVFWQGALTNLVDDDSSIDDLLEALEARDLVRREPTSRVQDDVEYVFKHLLIREAAYATVPKATRRDRHRATAEYLEQVGAGKGGAAAVLAHHWREAGEPDRAVANYLVAADQAARGWAKWEAVRLYDEALELVDAQDAVLGGRIKAKRGVARQMVLHQVLDAGQLSRPRARDGA